MLRQVLKAANRQGWLAYVPDLSPPYKASGKITHRAWFSPDEYRKLYEATRRRAEKPLKKRWKWPCEQLHDYVLFMANTGVRPDEALRLEYRDVSIVRDHATRQTILEIEVRGKRGVGYCKSTTGAVLPFRRLVAWRKTSFATYLFVIVVQHPECVRRRASSASSKTRYVCAQPAGIVFQISLWMRHTLSSPLFQTTTYFTLGP